MVVDEGKPGPVRTETVEVHSTIRFHEMLNRKRLILSTEPLAVLWVFGSICHNPWMLQR
jgi:hypothetical protein